MDVDEGRGRGPNANADADGNESDLLRRLRKVLALEGRQGYADRAVFGGLEAFIRNLAARLDPRLAEALVTHARGYGEKTLPQRVSAVRELEDVLRAADAGVDVDAGLMPEPVPDMEPNPDPEVLHAPVRTAKGVGPRREQALRRLGIHTVEDLLLYFPRRIEDRSQVKRIAQLRHGERATVRGRITAMDTVKPRPGLELLKVAVQDGSGVLFAVWFNQPWLKTQMAPGMRIALFGEASREFGQLQMSNPVWEPAEDGFLTGRLVPVYPATEGLPQTVLLRLIRDNLARYQGHLQEVLPEEIRARQDLLPRAQAFWKIHFPESEEDFQRARCTLAFEELFLFQLGVALHKAQERQVPGRALTVADEVLEDFEVALPFALTGAQRRAIEEVRKDLASEAPMRRLLQGDVGSGKTAVAAAACLIAVKSGYQATVMAPTEILAEQHRLTFQALLEPFDMDCELLIGSLSEPRKAEVRRRVQDGEVDLLIGTHALIQDEVHFARLGLAVIDEQHRFGVIQRAQLEAKGENLDVLVMSATPIPRTITLTLYGQFDVTILDELPWEKRVRTYWIAENRRQEVYRLVAQEVRRGAQAYVVYPLVEESEELDLRAAVQMKEELEETHFRGLRVGLMHGRLPEAEKKAVMRALRDRELDVLVSTTVIEVGIDVPDASVMVIEHAERFGLSQLHQLRGRIGRSGQKATCFAIATARTEEARSRLEAFQSLEDGFAIAEEDLRIRGPGELLGLAQHGLDSTFRAADLIRDLELMQRARAEAALYLKGHPDTPLIGVFRRRFGERFEWARF